MTKPGRTVALAWWLGVAAAQAAPNDFVLLPLGNPTPGGAHYSGSANANFRAFSRELGAALTSVNLMPPSTLGYNGFAITTELSILSLNTDRFVFPTEGAFSGPLLVPSLHVRKGLPYSFEVGARTGWIQKSSLAVATIELKWAIEGYLNIPDFGVRAHLMRLFNARDFDLFATGVDLGMGKRFAIAGMMTITPYLGWNLVFVGAYSNTVDFNPGRSYADSVAFPTAQLQDTGVYDDVSPGSNLHHRFYAGFRFALGILQLGAEASYSRLGRIRDAGIGGDRTLPSLLAINTTLGLDF
jgi:hypothetical protein